MFEFFLNIHQPNPIMGFVTLAVPYFSYLNIFSSNYTLLYIYNDKPWIIECTYSYVNIYI